MGNRAIITTKKRDLGVYLHWNGGRDSVGAFLEYCELRGFRAPDGDTYGWARLCQVICNYMGAEGLSVGISRYDVNVNPSFTDSTNAIAPIAPTHPRRFRQRQAPFPASRSGARSFVR